MTIRLKVAWILSILATALASFGFVGNGTSASFSDTVTVTHKLQTGHLKLRIVAVDGQALEPPEQNYRLFDEIKGADVDITRVVELRNEGSVGISSLFLTTTPKGDGDAAVAEQLSLTVGLDDGTSATEASAGLADWAAASRKLELPSPLGPGASLTVTMHTSGKLDADGKSPSAELAYAFTAYAGE